MTVFPPEIYLEIINYSFCVDTPRWSRYGRQITPRQDALPLTRVSRVFNALCEGPLFASITITRSDVWTALFDGEVGLLVTGERAEERRGRVFEVRLDLAALPPAIVDWGFLSEHVDCAADLPADALIVVPGLQFLPLPRVRYLVFETPFRPIKKIPLVIQAGVSFDYANAICVPADEECPLSREALLLARQPFFDLVTSLVSLQNVKLSWNDALWGFEDIPQPGLLAGLLAAQPGLLIEFLHLPFEHPRCCDRDDDRSMDWLRACVLDEYLGRESRIDVGWLECLQEESEWLEELQEELGKLDEGVGQNWVWWRRASGLQPAGLERLRSTARHSSEP